jgi:hypothetical protein
MRVANFAAAIGGLLLAWSAPAALVNFNYTQNDSTTGSGQIDPFTISAPGGDINFSATPLPAAVVNNSNPGTTPAGFVGYQTALSGSGNETNNLTGLIWSGSVTATGTRGGETWTIQIPLRFVPKQTQTPDVSDYTWSVTYGDSTANGLDSVTSAAVRTAMWLSRDTLVDAADTANMFQRYTQDNKTFVAGADTFTNTNTFNTVIKDATDSGDPQGVDAAGRDLAFYFGWRDQGGFTSGGLAIDTFTVGGLLNADDATLVPEPSSAVVLAAGLLMWSARRK